MEVSGRFVMSGILALLLMAMAGCSFKKDPASGKAPTLLVQEKSVPATTLSLEEIISSADEDQAIELLVDRKSEMEALAKDPSVSALDLAIKYDKVKILNFLLISGHSPFVLNQNSREKLAYDENLSKLLRSAQTDSLMDILRAYPRKFNNGFAPGTSMQLFRSRLESYQLGARGCEQFADLLMQRAYLNRDPLDPGDYYEVFNMLNPTEVFRSLLTEPVCSANVGRLSIELVSRWVSYEYLYQFQSSFASIDFLKYLVSLKRGISLSIILSAGGWHADHLGLISSHVRVNPLSLLMLKKSCVRNEGLLDEWVALSRQIVNHDIQYYSYPYLFPDEAINANLNCSGESKYCSENYTNIKNLWVIYRYAFPNAQISEQDFYDLYIGRATSYTPYSIKDADVAKFRNDLCAAPDRRSL